jgi:hypothetical protein
VYVTGYFNAQSATDAQIASLNYWLSNYRLDSSLSSSSQLTSGLQLVRTLPALRAAVSNASISGIDVLPRYNAVVAALLLFFPLLARSFVAESIVPTLMAMQALAVAKDATGLERTYAGVILLKQSFESIQSYNELVASVANATAGFNVFTSSYASADQISAYAALQVRPFAVICGDILSLLLGHNDTTVAVSGLTTATTSYSSNVVANQIVTVTTTTTKIISNDPILWFNNMTFLIDGYRVSA